MNKIDQIFAQRSKRNNTSTPNNSKRQDTQPPSQSPLPQQLSMSNYLTGSRKAQSSHSRSSRIPRSTRSKSSTSNERNRRYDTGFDSAGLVSGARPLTMSKLMKHDSSLDRDNKCKTDKPFTSSNFGQHVSFDIPFDVTFKKLNITSSRDINESIPSSDVILLLKPKIYQAIKFICEKKKRPDLNSI